jgi:REP element-mobilizing transposase RayT
MYGHGVPCPNAPRPNRAPRGNTRPASSSIIHSSMNINNKYNPEIHHRRSVRLRNFDYSRQGLYFVTICVQNGICIFGDIENGEMRLNEIGEIVRREWLKTAELRPNVQLHEYAIMPNHFHAIVEITEQTDGNYVRARRAVPLRTSELPQSRFQNIGRSTLSSIIGGFKSAVTRNIHAAGYDFAWHRNLWEHIVRDFDGYARIADYIKNNPFRWKDDTFYKI